MLYCYIAGAANVIGMALLLNYSNSYTLLILQKTRLPFMFFALIISTNIEFFPLMPASIGALFFIFALFYLIKTDQYIEAKNAFNAAALIGIGSLFWAYQLWFVPLYMYGMFRMKVLTIRTGIATLLGLGTVYWFVFGWCVWQHDFTALREPYHQLKAFDISLPYSQANDLRRISAFGMMLLLLLSYVYNRFSRFERSIRTHHLLTFFFIFALYAFSLLFLYGEQHFPGFLYFFYIPVSLLLAYSFSEKYGVMPFVLYYVFLMLLLLLTLLQIWMM